MENSPTIQKVDKKLKSPLNYHYLREIGLKHIETLSGKIWTDYNAHDPGLTILEVLSYALTDLAYRVDFPVEDLIADKNDNETAMRKQFQTALQILPSKPLTITDYRKLLIDLPGIKNAWFEPAKAEKKIYLDKIGQKLEHYPPAHASYEEVQINGLYSVLIELEEGLSEQKQNRLKSEALKRLQINRNLCEDFKSVDIVPTQDFILCAELELAPDAPIEKIEAQVYHELQNHLSPGVRAYTLAQMLDKGKKAEDIYNGPLMVSEGIPFTGGFIDDDELKASSLKSSIKLSDIIRIIMSIKGVVAVKDVIIKPNVENLPDNWNKWDVPIKQGHQPKLQINQCRLVHYKDVLPFKANQSLMLEELNKIRQNEWMIESQAKVTDLPMIYGSFVDPGNYQSISGDFPMNYGIGKFGLPKKSSRQRQAKARQMKVFLLFYDQLMANYFAQLAHIRELFSNDETIRKTYFTQAVMGVSGSEELYFSPLTLEEDIQDRYETQQQFLERRNTFLDHLLARFNEQFNEYALLMYSLSQEEETKDDLIFDKAVFLQDFPSLSRNRGIAFDHSNKNELWDTFNVSGLQHRVARLLGISNYSRRNLSKITYDIYEEKDDDNILEYRFRIKDKATDKILISSSTKYREKEKALEEMRLGVQLGFSYEAYQKKETTDGRYYFNLIDSTGEVIARRIEYFKTEAERDDAIRHLRRFLLNKYSGEGMFLIEHLLLRPKSETEALMPLCLDLNRDECTDTDPYSFRISIILPAWEKRFADMNFRKFFEKTLRMETPAHILPRICWVNEEDMSVFENAYKNWLFAHQNYPKNIKAYEKALLALTQAISKVKNVYPEGQLHDCAEGADEYPIILGRTNLGKPQAETQIST